jgi:membrane protein DedA with SNARE-associated domain
LARSDDRLTALDSEADAVMGPSQQRPNTMLTTARPGADTIRLDARRVRAARLSGLLALALALAESAGGAMTAHVTQWVADLGLGGVFVLMAVDAVLPAGGELVMLFAGALAAGAIAGHDASSLPAAIAAGTLGYLVGSLAGWAVGKAGGRPFIERYGRWLHLGPQRFRRAERWFERWGSSFVLFGRLTPLVRSFVSIPAGALEYRFAPYLALTSLASLIWCAGFGIAGHALGTHWDSVHHAFRYADYAAVALLCAVAAAWLVRARRSVA